MGAPPFPEPAARTDVGTLGVGTGLLILLRESLEALPAGAVVAARTSGPAAAHDLPVWCCRVGRAEPDTDASTACHNSPLPRRDHQGSSSPPSMDRVAPVM
jgi:hypothetical protein